MKFLQKTILTTLILLLSTPSNANSVPIFIRCTDPQCSCTFFGSDHWSEHLKSSKNYVQYQIDTDANGLYASPYNACENAWGNRVLIVWGGMYSIKIVKGFPKVIVTG